MKDVGEETATTGGSCKDVVFWGSGRFPLEQAGKGMFPEKVDCMGRFC